jgi:hypothetical protein
MVMGKKKSPGFTRGFVIHRVGRINLTTVCGIA